MLAGISAACAVEVGISACQLSFPRAEEFQGFVDRTIPEVSSFLVFTLTTSWRYAVVHCRFALCLFCSTTHRQLRFICYLFGAKSVVEPVYNMRNKNMRSLSFTFLRCACIEQGMRQEARRANCLARHACIGIFCTLYLLVCVWHVISSSLGLLRTVYVVDSQHAQHVRCHLADCTFL